MIGLGTIINVACILAGGFIGLLAGKKLSERFQSTLNMATGVSVLFIGISGALEGLLSVEGSGIVSGRAMFLTLCLTIGALLGEILNIEDGLERFGEWLKLKTGNAGDAGFVNAFVTASLTVSIGAMAIMGSLQDGITGNYSILATKGVLDLVVILLMTGAMGKGCIFSAIPVGVVEGGLTLLARLISPILTDAAVANISCVGSVLIFCIGVNLMWGKKVRVANLLPAVLLAAAAAYL